jgi:peptidyl-prolyl cis-trans isomerase C
MIAFHDVRRAGLHWRRTAFAAASLTLLAAAPALAQIKPLDGGPDPVVAMVDGIAIQRSDIVQMQRSLPPQFQQMPLEVLYPVLLERMIDIKLLYDAGSKAKLTEDPEVKQRVRLYEERVVQETYLQRYIDKEMNEAALKKRYEKYTKETPARDEVSARHILVQTEAQAKEVLAQLKKGADFAELARTKSLDPGGKQEGGSLGYFTREEMVPEFSEAAFKLKDGEITPAPVKTQYGWHIIKVEAHRKTTPPFEEMREKLSSDLQQELMTDLVGKLRKTAKVERFNLDGTPAAPGAPTLPKAPARLGK